MSIKIDHNSYDFISHNSERFVSETLIYNISKSKFNDCWSCCEFVVIYIYLILSILEV